MKGLVLAGTVVLLGAVLLARSEVPADAQTASRIVDRTFVCTPMAFGGVRDLDLRANPTNTDPRTIPRTIPAYLIVRTGTSAWDTNLVFVRSRVHDGSNLAGAPEAGPGGAYASARRCAPSSRRVSLEVANLPGPPVTYYSTATCPLAGRVLVRVRAVLTKPANWRRATAVFLGASRPVIEASLAVRSERTGEPLAFMQVDKAGKTRLWTANRCT